MSSMASEEIPHPEREDARWIIIKTDGLDASCLPLLHTAIEQAVIEPLPGHRVRCAKILKCELQHDGYRVDLRLLRAFKPVGHPIECRVGLDVLAPVLDVISIHAVSTTIAAHETCTVASEGV